MKKRLLLIDDDVALTDVTKVILEDTGAYVVEVENFARYAVETARNFQPDLILLDYLMPEIDGGDMSGLFKADPQLCDIPIIVITALVSNKDMERGPLLRGDLLFIAKPIRFELLLEIIEQQLRAAAAKKKKPPER